MIPRRSRRRFAHRMAALAAREERERGETRQMARARWRVLFFRRWSHRFRRAT